MIGAVGWLVIYTALHGNVAVQKASPRAEVTPARLDLNQANRAELELLPGVGPQVAQRIEAYRILYGPFPNVDELRKVPGIGPQLLERSSAACGRYGIDDHECAEPGGAAFTQADIGRRG